MSKKIDIRDIIKNHIKTLYDYSTSKISIIDISVFFILPLLLSVLLVFLFYYKNTEIDFIKKLDTTINTTVTVYSIFTGLLLNLLVLVFDIKSRTTLTSKTKAILKETFHNISYSIVISIFALIIALFLKISITEICYGISISHLLLGVLFYLSINFGLTLLMILKRVYNLLSVE